jgi:hypothetical protein
MKLHPILFSTFVLVALALLPGCRNQSIKENRTDAKAELELANLNALTLLQNNCLSCHTMEMVSGKRTAPPLFMVRRHYFKNDISKEDFVNKIIRFVNNTTEDNSIMPGAVRNFGLMPKQAFKEENLLAIAAYIFENDFESEEWKEKWKEFKTTEAISR